ncbi:hypothetical protein Dimus_018427, partial [Dionaea muscipula]
MDAFWDTLHEVDGTSSSTAAGLSQEVRLEEVVQMQETIQTRTSETSSVLPTNEENQSPQLLQESVVHKDKAKDSMEVDPSGPMGVPAQDERIAASYAWVDEGLYPRDIEILLATDPWRLRGAMMVNLTARFKKLEKKRDEREKEYQKQMIELKEASTWGQKLQHENGELLKQVDTHKTLISSLSVEV